MEKISTWASEERKKSTFVSTVVLRHMQQEITLKRNGAEDKMVQSHLGMSRP